MLQGQRQVYGQKQKTLQVVSIKCILPRQKKRRYSNIYSARWPVYKLAEQFPKKYSKGDKKKEEEKDRSDNYFASSAPSPLPPQPAKATP